MVLWFSKEKQIRLKVEGGKNNFFFFHKTPPFHRLDSVSQQGLDGPNPCLYLGPFLLASLSQFSWRRKFSC